MDQGGLLEDGLELELGEQVLRFPAIWLRDNCPCPRCLDPGTGQKLTNLARLPAGCAVAQAAPGPESVEVVFAPDGHRSAFSRAWLAAHALTGPAPADGRDERGKQLWQAADLAGRLPERDWEGYRDDPAQRESGLDAVLRLGFALLRGVPAEPGMVLTVAESFGYPRETNYGRMFDVKVEPDPGHLASTSHEITPHTDNPYRDPLPTIQLLHCLRNAAQGGDTGLVDGFAAAAALRAADPGAFATLTATAVPFAYRDTRTELRASAPLIETGPGGQIRGVRFNNRTVQPLRLGYHDVTRFYQAYQRWAALLAQPRWRLDLPLAAGDCLIFDNTRILHARTAFSDGAAGERLLQGCYADLDSLASSLAVLRRGTPA